MVPTRTKAKQTPTELKTYFKKNKYDVTNVKICDAVAKVLLAIGKFISNLLT